MGKLAKLAAISALAIGIFMPIGSDGGRVLGSTALSSGCGFNPHPNPSPSGRGAFKTLYTPL
ncbi:MAG: hypothetical protein R3E39_31470 [Anaerolineae bacterium]